MLGQKITTAHNLFLKSYPKNLVDLLESISRISTTQTAPFLEVGATINGCCGSKCPVQIFVYHTEQKCSQIYESCCNLPYNSVHNIRIFLQYGQKCEYKYQKYMHLACQQTFQIVMFRKLTASDSFNVKKTHILKLQNKF